MIGALAPLVGGIVNKFVDKIPDGNERARAKEQLEKELVDAANQVMLAQTRINEQEAKHQSIWVSGWRPAVGWLCVCGIGWAILWGDGTELPSIDTSYLTELLMGLLGMSGLRTFEKMKNVARS